MDVGLLDLLKPKAENNAEQPQATGDHTIATHITTYGPSQMWIVPDPYYVTFWRKYCQVVIDSESGNLCLAEAKKPHMPIIADLVLKFNARNNTEAPTLDFILYLVYCYQQIIRETLKISDSNVELICCVLEAEPDIEDDQIIYKIRLQFPYCKTQASIQNRLIRPLVLQMFRSENIISKLSSQPNNDWEDIVDPLVVEKPVMMYGSSAVPNSNKLRLQYIFGSLTREQIKTNHVPVMEESNMFFFKTHGHVGSGIVPLENFPDTDIDPDIDYEFWLPFFLSIHYYDVITLPKQAPPPDPANSKIIKLDTHTRGHNNTRSHSTNSSSFNNEEDKDSPEYLTSVFLSMLSRSRADEEHYWLDIGKCLFKAFNGEDRGLEKWINFSEQSDSHDEQDCTRCYRNFSDVKLSIKTLAFYAREDSPTQYKKWHEEWYKPYLEKATSGTHGDIAEAIYRVYWLEFACSNLSKHTIYHFKNHIWKRLDSGHTLRTMISGEFLSKFEAFRTNVAIQIQNSHDPHFKEQAEFMIQKICKLIAKLKNRAFKNSVFLEAAEKFHIDIFERYLDEDPELMGCLNGIIQCLDTKAVFRDGKPEDYVSRSTGVQWRRDMHEKHEFYVKLMEYLRKVFPDKNLLRHFGKLMGASLKGRNSDKIFPIHTGKGNNSKSILKKLIDLSYGDYVITFPTSTFTANKAGGGADPSLARSRYAHIAFIQEPDAETPLKSGTLKEFTGGDRFFARFLHDNGSEITPMFTLHMMCNVVPIIPQCDQAIKNRVRILPYLSTWSKEAPKSEEDQFDQKVFLLDPFFEKQLPDLIAAFLYFCVKMYSIYRKEGLVDPEIVTKYTSEYWEDNDLYAQFLKEHIEKAFKITPDDYKGPLCETRKNSLNYLMLMEDSKNGIKLISVHLRFLIDNY